MNLVCLLAVALVLAGAARAEHTRYWRQADFSDFHKGTATGVAIRSDGKIGPAPKFDPFADPNLAYVWSLRLDSKSRLYAAGGSDAKVLRFDEAGKATTVFESSELAAQSIAFDASDNLYVGTSPDGKVYKVTPEGVKSTFFEPKTKYIWALAIDRQNALFVATGDTGKVFVVAPDGKSRLFWQSRERHARSLAFDAKGNLLIGTEPNGLIVRVDVKRTAPADLPEAGTPFVLHETNKAEITSLALDANGNIYAAAIGDKGHLPELPRVLPSPVPQVGTPVIVSGGTVVTQAQPATQPSTYHPFPSVSTTGGAEVVRIAPDGSPETLWTSRDGLVFALGFSLTGKLLLGTGDMGSLIELEGNGVYSSVASTASAQVTSLITGGGGKVFVATANPGKIFTLGPGYEPNGSFESSTFDARIFSRWGRVTWWGEGGSAKAKVEFYVRSGNTSSPAEDWSTWAGPYKDSGTQAVDCPPARFLQWKAVFSDVSEESAPTVSWVSLAYQPKNVAPVIDDIAVQDPGIRLSGFPSQTSGPASPMPVALRMPQGPGGTPSGPPADAEARSSESNTDATPQGLTQKGYQSVLWSAHDDNDDQLLFTIYYRGEGERDWRLLKDKITQRYYSWDATSMPDGAYYLKIVASDSPSNPASEALSSARAIDGK
jgi:sugar lactone lactonase YvrE